MYQVVFLPPPEQRKDIHSQLSQGFPRHIPAGEVKYCVDHLCQFHFGLHATTRGIATPLPGLFQIRGRGLSDTVTGSICWLQNYLRTAQTWYSCRRCASILPWEDPTTMRRCHILLCDSLDTSMSLSPPCCTMGWVLAMEVWVWHGGMKKVSR